MMSVWMRIVASLILALAGSAAIAADGAGTTTGLQVPRFVSLKSDKVNVRTGPTKDHDVAWVYNRAALPVEVTAEFENWRRIRDWEGAEGWVYHSLLSGKRTALVAPSKNKDELLPLHYKPDAASAVSAVSTPIARISPTKAWPKPIPGTAATAAASRPKTNWRARVIRAAPSQRPRRNCTADTERAAAMPAALFPQLARRNPAPWIGERLT